MFPYNYCGKPLLKTNFDAKALQGPLGWAGILKRDYGYHFDVTINSSSTLFLSRSKYSIYWCQSQGNTFCSPSDFCTQQHPVDHTKGHAVDCSNLNFPPRMSMGTAASRTATSLSVDSRQISTAAASTRDGTSRAGLRSGGHCPASRALERVGPGLQSTVSTMSLSTPPQCVADHNVEQDDRDKPVLARLVFIILCY